MGTVRINYGKVNAAGDGFIEASNLGQQALDVFKKSCEAVFSQWEGNAKNHGQNKNVENIKELTAEIEYLAQLGKQIKDIAAAYKKKDEGGFFAKLGNFLGGAISAFGSAIGLDKIGDFVGKAVSAVGGAVSKLVSVLPVEEIGHALVGAAQVVGTVLLTPIIGPAAPLLVGVGADLLNLGVDALAPEITGHKEKSKFEQFLHDGAGMASNVVGGVISGGISSGGGVSALLGSVAGGASGSSGSGAGSILTSVIGSAITGKKDSSESRESDKQESTFESISGAISSASNVVGVVGKIAGLFA